MPGVSLDQLLKTPQIKMAIRLLAQTDYFFTNFMGFSVTDAAPGMVVDNRHFGYDQYASTRTVATATAPDAPPAESTMKPIGTKFATIPRFHNFKTIYENKIFGGRPIGGPYGTVDERGQRYIGLQLEDLVTEFRNAREFMMSRMLRGGFGLKPVEGDQFRLCEVDDAARTITNDYGIPADNKGDLGGIIADGEAWSAADAPIFEHLMEIEKRQTRRVGFMPRHILLNSATIAPVFENTVLQSIRGSAFRIFETFTRKPLNEQDALSAGFYTVVFGALPQYQWHVVNTGLVLDQVTKDVASQIDANNFKLHIPDGYAMILPEPRRGVLYDFASARELVRERVDQRQSRLVTGFDIWTTPEINPARYNLNALDNTMPILTIPDAVIYANVWRVGL